MQVMVYVDVLVADISYHGSDSLTYSHTKDIPLGTVVEVSVKTKVSTAVVVSKATTKPPFKVKPIINTLPQGVLPKQNLALLGWMRDYYPAPPSNIVQLFLPHKLTSKKTTLTPIATTPNPQTLPPLTTEQEYALSKIKPQGMHILHGATGSGKTRVYVEKAIEAMGRNKSVVILTPEIGLTSQLAETFIKTFGQQVIVWHSRLTEATRRRYWQAILTSTTPLIVVGTRSALFSPLKDIGLIVVDEAHETAYKQDKSPYYHTSHVAAKLASLHHCPIILGSATPAITDYFYAEQKKCPIIRMQSRATQQIPTDKSIKVVDLKDRTQFSKKPYLSDILLSSIRSALQQHKQTLLFLNRRGTARLVLCEDCGWQANCPHCDIPVIYHSDSHSVRCHSCDYRSHPPQYCPICNNSSVLFKTIGTKAIVEEMSKIFPEARIQRFDTDNNKTERLEAQYELIKSGGVDIIVGTQTLAKGLDLPNLSLVGVIIADTSLYIPDFSAKERTYQMLSQVIGRVGRGHTASQVIIQTYNPENPLLNMVVKEDWDNFYESETAERQRFLFPPYCYILKLWCRRNTQKGAQNASQKLAITLHTLQRPIIIEGPAPAFQERINGQYEWQLIVKAKRRDELLAVVQHLPANWHYDIDPMNLL